MAATDDERRRVAEKLREFVPHSDENEIDDIDCLLAEMVMGDEFCPNRCGECFEMVCERLADLIEPSCDREALGVSE